MSQKYRISSSQARALYEPLEGQADIEEAIAEAKRLAAPPQAKAKHADLAKKGALGANNKLREIEQQLSIALAKKKQNGTRKNASVQYNGPTPERAAKAHEGVASEVVIPSQGPVPAVRSHTVQSPLEKYKYHLRPGLEDTARRLLKIFLLAETGGRVTSSYEGMSGNVPGPRSGGVQEHVRWATAIAQVIESEWPKEFVEVKDWFLLEITVNQNGSAMKFEDAGLKMGIPWKSPDTHKGAGYARFVDMLIVAEKFLQRQDALGWADPPNANATRALQSELRARAQVRREIENRRSRNRRDGE